MSDIAKKDPKQTSWRPNNPKSKEKLMCTLVSLVLCAGLRRRGLHTSFLRKLSTRDQHPDNNLERAHLLVGTSRL
jgi:hypothetical protein